MDHKNLSINPQTLKQFASIVCAFVRNLGGDDQQLAKKLAGPLHMRDLSEALSSLGAVWPLTAAIKNGNKEEHSLFRLELHPASVDTSNTELEAFYLEIKFHHPNMKKPISIGKLFAAPDFVVVGFTMGVFNTSQEMESMLNAEKMAEFFTDLRQGFGAQAVEVLQKVAFALANAISPHDLTISERALQTKANTLLGQGSDMELPIAEQLAVKLPDFLQFIELVFDLEAQELYQRFETVLVQKTQAQEPLLLEDVTEAMVHHPELKRFACSLHAEADKSAHITELSLEIPLFDDNESVLDFLVVTCSASNFVVSLNSGYMAYAARPPHKNIFVAKRVAKLVRASKVLSAEKAAENKALLVKTLGEFSKVLGEGKTKQAVQQALFTLSSLS